MPAATRPRPAASGPNPVGSAVVATLMETAFAHRSWSITTPAGRPRCHVIYLLHGTATYSDDSGAVTELTAPFMLWLPRQAQGEFRLAAGGDGAMASIADAAISVPPANPRRFKPQPWGGTMVRI